jgi:hypothetical protein
MREKTIRLAEKRLNSRELGRSLATPTSVPFLRTSLLTIYPNRSVSMLNTLSCSYTRLSSKRMAASVKRLSARTQTTEWRIHPMYARSMQGISRTYSALALPSTPEIASNGPFIQSLAVLIYVQMIVQDSESTEC